MYTDGKLQIDADNQKAVIIIGLYKSKVDKSNTYAY
jgi:hypothetical protein